MSGKYANWSQLYYPYGTYPLRRRLLCPLNRYIGNIGASKNIVHIKCLGTQPDYFLLCTVRLQLLGSPRYAIYLPLPTQKGTSGRRKKEEEREEMKPECVRGEEKKYSLQMAAHPRRLSVCREKNISLQCIVSMQGHNFLRLFSFFL